MATQTVQSAFMDTSVEGLIVTTRTQILIPPPSRAQCAETLVEYVTRVGNLFRPGRTIEVAADQLREMVQHVVLCSDDAPLKALIDIAKTRAPLGDLIVSDIIPTVANELGERWLNDTMSFVDVTIAATRLQDAVRLMSPAMPPALQQDAVAVIVPPWEQHTLAPAVLADRLRRSGIPTRTLSGLHPTEITSLLARVPVAAAFISAGSIHSLHRVPDLISAIRHAINRHMPIIVGGPALASEARPSQPLGADHISNDMSEALRFAGMALSSAQRDTEDVPFNVTPLR